MDRRGFLLSPLLVATCALIESTNTALASGRKPADLPFVGVLGRYADPQAQDKAAADAIAARLPHHDAYAIMQALANLKDTGGPEHEKFNARWRYYGNPLLIKFFKDIGYSRTPDPGDCTSWCAATLAWCLKRAGNPIPKLPASSQSFLRYGHRIALEEARRGDICVFTDLGNVSHGHVGFFVERPTTGTVKLLGGNQGGSGGTNCAAGYPRSRIALFTHPIDETRLRSISHKYLSSVRRVL